MNKKIKQIRVKKYAGIIKIFITICFWACLLSAILCAVLGIIFLLFPDAYSFFLKPFGSIGQLPFAMGNEGIVGIELSDMLEYATSSSLLSGIEMKPIYEVLIFRVAVSQAILTVFFYHLILILKSVKEDHPFARENSNRLSVMGILLIAYTIVIRIGEYVMLKQVLGTVNIPNVNLKFSFNTGGILLGLLIILLAGIFKYGSYLQKEYDTTL